jgi:hypothetical protein
LFRRKAAVNQVWTEDEKEYVRANAGLLTDAALAVSLTKITGRVITLNGVRRQRQKMGLRKKHGRGVCKLADGVPSVRVAPRRPLGVPLTIRAAVAAEEEQGSQYGE